MRRIGVISDTHGYLDPRVKKYLENVDEIWHAGDIGSEEVLQELREFKPTRAVYGNCDGWDIRSLTDEFYRFKVEDMDVLLTHIGGYPRNYNPLARRKFESNPPQLFVCGHSHILKVQFDPVYKMLCLNPGAAGRYGFHKVQTLLRFAIDGKEIKDMEVIELQFA